MTMTPSSRQLRLTGSVKQEIVDPVRSRPCNIMSSLPTRTSNSWNTTATWARTLAAPPRTGSE